MLINNAIVILVLLGLFPELSPTFRDSHLQMFFIIDVLKNFTLFTGVTFRSNFWSSFVGVTSGLSSVTHSA